jgi:hypothetical protein
MHSVQFFEISYSFAFAFFNSKRKSGLSFCKLQDVKKILKATNDNGEDKVVAEN